MYYANILNNKIIGSSECKSHSENLFQIEITEEIYQNINRYEYKNGTISEIENYEELRAKEERKAEILNELNALDLKSIRALRAYEAERLQELENKAIELRKEYNSL